MPHNNRVTAGNALKTTDIWTKTIGHNPVSVPIPIIPAIRQSFCLVYNFVLFTYAFHTQLTHTHTHAIQYANEAEAAATAESESNAEKARGLLELARHQNLTGGRSGGGDAGGDDFARYVSGLYLSTDTCIVYNSFTLIHYCIQKNVLGVEKW